ncbi:nicotinamidase/pyrazinamidase [Micromonospora sp. Llam0]|uniref:nicotinamidase n=1 Tax=Micromonospora sp. Llam0 TaxID=2485143 RepID=UPI000F483733|nr:nicotinamidase [Micromonospora sp. Llam0]ROO58310.1 nicotinamidase/pyrazinamidase [Micromonospora sp. Llam0]
MHRALIIVDVQNDFCEGGSLAVGGGTDVAAAISRTVAEAPQRRWRHVVATKDYHVDPGAHFGDPPDFVDTWPAHCVVGTGGDEFHPGLATDRIEAVFRKGQYAAAYSGFEGRTDDGTDLADWLRERGITGVDVVGIATDHCVRATALDAARAGFDTTVLLDLTAGVARATTEVAVDAMRAAGVTLTGSPVLRPA